MVSKSICRCTFLTTWYGEDLYIIGCEGNAIVDGIRVKDACACAVDGMLNHMALGATEMVAVSGPEDWLGAWPGQRTNPH